MMQRHNEVPKRPRTVGFHQRNTTYDRRRYLVVAVIALLTTASLACMTAGTKSSLSNRRIVIKTLPTLTSTLRPVANPAIAQSDVAPEAPVAASDPTQAPQLVATPTEIFISADLSPPMSTPSVETVDVPAPDAVVLPAGTAVAQAPATPFDGLTTVSGEAQVGAPPVAATDTPVPTSLPTALPTEIPPTSTPTVPPTPTSLPEGWVFSGVQVSSEQNGGFPLLYGDVINNTGSPQVLFSITGNFYDNQGQLMSDALTIDYWPIEIIPQGGQVPFELMVMDSQNVGNFDLNVDAAPTEDKPHQDFEFLDVNQSIEDGRYCLHGKLRNLGESLQHYLSIAAVLYDGQHNVINFGDEYSRSPDNLVGDQTTDFEVCVDSFGQEIADHEVRAWGL